MIKTMSDQIGKGIGRELGYTQAQIDVLSYGLQIILGVGFKVLSIILISWILGVLEFTMIALFTFAIFRFIAGGVHCSTYGNCYSVSIILFVLVGWVVNRIDLQVMGMIMLSFVIGAFAAIVVVRWIPGDTEKKRISDYKVRYKLKVKTMILLIGWGIFNTFLITKEILNTSLAINLGILLEMFLVTPVGYRLINNLDSSLARVQQKGGKLNDQSS